MDSKVESVSNEIAISDFEKSYKKHAPDILKKIFDEYKIYTIYDFAADEDFIGMQELIDEYPLNAKEIHSLLVYAMENLARWRGEEAAKARHIKTNEKKQAIVDYWRNNISEDKSNEFAAELLQKQFPDMAHRTLARYIAEAKKIPPASTL